MHGQNICFGYIYTINHVKPCYYSFINKLSPLIQLCAIPCLDSRVRHKKMLRTFSPSLNGGRPL